MRYGNLMATAISSFCTLVMLLSVPLITSAQESSGENSPVIWIGLASGSETEATMASELRNLIRKYDLEPWLLTRKVLVDRTQIPHSHPILTIHARHVGDEIMLLSTLVHEQLHWLEADPWLDDFMAAMTDFEAIYPVVPSAANGGARDQQSTYRHLLVCDMELQALTTLLGEKTARETLVQITHYEWVYDKVLNDPRIREIAVRRGFNVLHGIPKR